MSEAVDQFLKALGGEVIDTSSLPYSGYELYMRRRLALRQDLDPDDPEVLARFQFIPDGGAGE